MKVSTFFVPTRKEVPKEAETPSHRMMLRSGLIRQHVAGVYTILPMGWRVLKNIMAVIRQEMEAIGCQEFYLPALSPRDLWTKSGRWDTFGDDMFRLKDRKGRELCLAPTHEEVFTEIAAGELHSYRDMPQMWYQIQTKFRDEVRPRSGLLRVRQFFMKDAYSFDVTFEGLDKSYALQREAYLKIFARAGLDVKVVEASSGAMGGRDCEEFMVLADSGDDFIVYCPSCGYAANQEVAISKIEKVKGDICEIQKIHTPGKKSIEVVSEFLGVEPSRLIKSLLYATQDGFALMLVRGDHQVDEGKLEAVLGKCRPAEPDEVFKFTGAGIGYISPVGLENVTVVADPILEGTTDLIAGANENGYHITGVDMARDIKDIRYAPLKAVEPGELCVKCNKPLDVTRGIEVGHIFKLGTRYSELLGATFLDEDGATNPIIMGSYGIGVERIMSSAIERYFDGNAMIWPREITPFMVEVLPLNTTNEEVLKVSEDLYTLLQSKGISVMLDDRDERAGVKFKDADLFGAPIQVVIGERGLKDGIAELRIRDKDISENVSIENLAESVLNAATNC